jgi:predicted DNA-binding protein
MWGMKKGKAKYMGEEWTSISIPKALKDRLEELATKEGISTAFYVRKLVEKALEQSKGR